MRALEFIRDHATFKLPYDFSYHMKTPKNWMKINIPYNTGLKTYIDFYFTVCPNPRLTGQNLLLIKNRDILPGTLPFSIQSQRPDPSFRVSNAHLDRQNHTYHWYLCLLTFDCPLSLKRSINFEVSFWCHHIDQKIQHFFERISALAIKRGEIKKVV